MFKVILLLCFVHCFTAFNVYNPSCGRNQKLRSRERDIPSDLSIWKQSKKLLPPIITGLQPIIIKSKAKQANRAQSDVGAWGRLGEAAGDENPSGALYNAVFVRLPAIAAAIWYSKKLISGDEAFMMTADLGFGPIVVSPVFVAFALIVILL